MLLRKPLRARAKRSCSLRALRESIHCRQFVSKSGSETPPGANLMFLFNKNVFRVNSQEFFQDNTVRMSAATYLNSWDHISSRIPI